MRIKEGVKITGVRPEIMLGLLVCECALLKRGHEVIVTELVGGTHSRTSLHPVGLAVDFRSKHIDSIEEKYDLLDIMKDSLGEKYDLLLENAGGQEEHFHLEYQPKFSL